MKKTFWLCFASLIFTSAYCNADVINIDLGRSSNASSGNINNLTEGSTVDTALELIDNTGAVSPLSLIHI